MKARSMLVLPLLAAGCTLVQLPAETRPAIPPGATINCGPIAEPERCQLAVEVALTAQLNPPPIAAASLRRPRADDDCVTQFHPCDAGSIIVTLQSGDTLQEVPLIPTGAGWVRLDLVR